MRMPAMLSAVASNVTGENAETGRLGLKARHHGER